MTGRRRTTGASSDPGAGAGDAPPQWLLVTISLTSDQASLRVHVWRKLRSLGAVYLQSSICLLPDRPDVVREVRRLLDRVRREGGTGRSLRMELSDATDVAWLRDEFNTARDDEYNELLERLPTLRQELSLERKRGRATYAEVEESEADLQRFRTWIAKIADRDYFNAPRGEHARTELEAAAEDLANFENEALEAEAPQPRAPQRRNSRRLRSVDDKTAGRGSGHG